MASVVWGKLGNASAVCGLLFQQGYLMGLGGDRFYVTVEREVDVCIKKSVKSSTSYRREEKILEFWPYSILKQCSSSNSFNSY